MEMRHPYIPPQLPPVIDEYIDAIQQDIRWRVAGQQTRNTLRERFGRACLDDIEMVPSKQSPLYRALIGHNVARPDVRSDR